MPFNLIRIYVSKITYIKIQGAFVITIYILSHKFIIPCGKANEAHSASTSTTFVISNMFIM